MRTLYINANLQIDQEKFNKHHSKESAPFDWLDYTLQNASAFFSRTLNKLHLQKFDRKKNQGIEPFLIKVKNVRGV